MIDARSPYRIGAVFLGISAILHLIAPLFAGLSGQAPILFVFGVVYVIAVWGLMRAMRWLAYVVMLVLMVGSVIAMTGIWAMAPVPGWIYAGIVFANWSAVLSLAAVLWRPKSNLGTAG